MEPEVEIRKLTLRVPGLPRDQAGRLGREVARRVAEGMAPRLPEGRLGRLEIKTAAPRGAGTGPLAAVVVRRILEGL